MQTETITRMEHVRRNVRFTAGFMLGMALIGGGVIFAKPQMQMILEQPRPMAAPVKYFVMGDLISKEVIPLDVPLTDSEVLAFAVKNMTDAFSFGDVKQDIKKLSSYPAFSPDAWSAMQKILYKAGMTEKQTVRHDLQLLATPAAAPVILKKDVGAGGRYHWQISVKVRFRVVRGGAEKERLSNVLLTVTRTPVLEKDSGVEITAVAADSLDFKDILQEI